MTPVIRHLQANFSELSLPSDPKSLDWTFDTRVKKFKPDFYRKLFSFQPVLNLEYSILCNQLRHNLSNPLQATNEQLIDQLTAALMLAELLEHVHLYYLNVPREVVRLRRQQEVYKTLLAEKAGYSFNPVKKEPINVGLSYSQQVRDDTAWANWYRLISSRGKRLLNLLDLVGTGSETFRTFVGMLDKYTNPFFAYLAWCFFIPRLTVSLFLTIKHTIPGFWMSEEEASLGWFARLGAQVQRRLFELVNDCVWATAGLLNCFLFIGALAPISIYVNLFAFAIDVANTGFRAYVELNRLFTLQEEYTALLQKEDNADNIKAIKEYQRFIQQRIDFEYLRLGLSVANAIGVFFAMSVALPIFALDPIVSLIGAFFIVGFWTTSFILTTIIEQKRPQDEVEIPVKVSTLGFFAGKKEIPAKAPPLQESKPEEDTFSSEGHSFS